MSLPDTETISFDRLTPIISDLLRQLQGRNLEGYSETEVECAVVCFLILHGLATGRDKESFIRDITAMLQANWQRILGIAEGTS